MATIDISSRTLHISFDKLSGITDVMVWEFNPDGSAIDLTGYSAEGEVKADCDATTNIWTLTTIGLTPNLVIESETFTTANPFVYKDADGVDQSLPKSPTTSITLWGIRFNIPHTVTSPITWDEAVYAIRLIAPSGSKSAFVGGKLRQKIAGCVSC